ncbi:MAG: hypothetical protein AAGB31_15180 [Bdellovibrio sp.]
MGFKLTVRSFLIVYGFGVFLSGCTLDASIWKESSLITPPNTGGGGTNPPGPALADVVGNPGEKSFLIPAGDYNGTEMCIASDDYLLAGNIRSTVNLFGTAGSFTGNFAASMMSGASRSPGTSGNGSYALSMSSLPLTLLNESSDYAGVDFPQADDLYFRDIPDQTQDDDGLDGVHCRYATRPTVACGETQATIAARIADCAAKNPSSSTWDGTTQCNGAEGLWRLVTYKAANQEVWRDERTQLIWSSKYTTGSRWCEAVSVYSEPYLIVPLGFYNTTLGTPMVGNGTIAPTGSWSTGASGSNVVITFSSSTNFSVSGGLCGSGGSITGGLTTTPGSTATYTNGTLCSFVITQGSTLFANGDIMNFRSGAPPYSCEGAASSPSGSLCLEEGTPLDGSENWATGVYSATKGGMGLNSIPSVHWRAPSLNDVRLAYLNGMAFVLPDAGIAGASRPSRDISTGGGLEWTAHRIMSTTLGNIYGLLYDSRSNNWSALITSSSSNLGVNNLVRCVGRAP